MINMAEDLRTPKNIMKADPRNEFFTIFDEKIRASRPITLKDRFSAIEKLKLKESVPEKIQIQFATAKNILLYSWYVYRFIPVAEMHAYSTVEMALRDKIGKKNWGLKRLLEYAIESGWISDDGFRLYREAEERRKVYDETLREIVGPDYKSIEDEKRKRYIEILTETLPILRNTYAHGSSSLGPSGYITLTICSEIINQLYSH